MAELPAVSAQGAQAPLPPVKPGAQPGQPPMGPSPVTRPTNNAGNQAAALAKVGIAVRILTDAIAPLMAADPEAGRKVMKAVTSLSEIAPPGHSPQGVENTALRNLQVQNQQASPMLSMLRQGAQGQQPPAQPGA